MLPPVCVPFGVLSQAQRCSSVWWTTGRTRLSSSLCGTSPRVSPVPEVCLFRRVGTPGPTLVSRCSLAVWGVTSLLASLTLWTSAEEFSHRGEEIPWESLWLRGAGVLATFAVGCGALLAGRFYSSRYVTEVVFRPKTKEVLLTTCSFMGTPSAPVSYPLHKVSCPFGSATSSLKTYKKFSYLKVHGHTGYFVLDRSEGATLDEEQLTRVMSIGK